MFKNWQIRNLLNVWAIVTVLTIVLMSALSLNNHQQYADNQAILLDQQLPLQEASREITAIASEFIARQQLILNADSRQMLLALPDRSHLEQSFEQQWQQLLALSRKLQIDRQLILPLQQNYQHFLQTDQQLFDLMLRQHQLNEQRNSLNPSAEAARRIVLQQQTNQQRLRDVLSHSVVVLQRLRDSLRQLSMEVIAQNKQRLSQSKTMLADFRVWVLLISAMLIVGMLLFVKALSRQIQQPLKSLRKAMRALTAENFDTRLPETASHNEFSQLARDFNQFAANTSQLIQALDMARFRLQDREQQLSAILNSVPEAILTLSADGTIINCNPAAEAVFGATEENIETQHLSRFLPFAETIPLAEIANQQKQNREYEGVNFSGQPISLWLSLRPLSEQGGIAWVAVVSDITDWKQTKLALQQTSSELNAILENAMVGIALVKDRQLIRVNHKFEQLFAASRQQLEGQSARCLHINEDTFQRFGEQAYRTLAQGENFEAQLEMQRFNGERFWCSLSGQAIDSAEPEAGSIWLYEDVTQQRQNEDRLTRLASVDSLTGLPNRSVFNDRLEHAIHKLQRNSGRLAVLFIDLDHFKHINDSLGHKAGDALLCEVARRVRSCVRESDTVARLGGDEFTVVLEDITSAQYVGRVAEKILTTTALPYMIDNIEVNISPSIGISLFPADGRDVDMLIRNADAAMYHAKNSGRNNFQFYSAEMNAEAANRLALETSLRRAVEQQEFYLQYQPQIELSTGRVMGAEVLLRWHTEQWGDVSPARFVPVLEDTGLIGAVGEWVLRETCTVFMANRNVLSDDFVMAVNLSGRQFKGSRLVSYIRQLLAETQMPASNLELEITESLLMDNTDSAIDTLRDLSSLGITLAIDDFGTGYSSLSYLKQFPLNVLKVDRAFVRDLTIDKDDAAIVGAIMAMASSLGLQVVAEGVETAEQLAYLEQKNCQRAQGFYFSKALDLDDLMAYLRQRENVRRA